MARSGQPLTFHGRNQALDGVRAAAVLAVMAYHASGSPFRGGYLGVDVFFVLSGFLITLVLVGDVQRCGHIRLGRFFVRRIARVIPAYLLLVAVVTAGTFVFSRAHARHALAAALPWLLSLTANWREAGHPGTLGYLTPLWSLSVEMQFYLLWPFVFGLVLRSRMTRPAILWSLCLVIVASSLWKGYLVLAVPHGGPRAYYGSDTRADELLIGATAALLLAWGYLRDTPVLRRWVSRITYVTLSFFAVAVFAPVDDSTWPWVGGLTILAAGLAVVIVGLVSGITALSQLLSRRVVVEAGVISYGLFLWHGPVWEAISPASLGVPGWAAALSSFAAPFVVAAASWRLVEAPVLRLAHGMTPRRSRSTARPPARVTATDTDPAILGGGAPPERHFVDPVGAAPGLDPSR